MAINKERQPGSSQREEFLIVLEYLLKYTYDRKHASSQAKIIDYAKSQYGVTIRRTRIGEILIHLEQLCAKYPNVFPFKLGVIELNAQRKYYVYQWQYSNQFITSVARSILNDRTKPRDVAVREIEQLLDNSVSPEKKRELQKSITKYDKKVKRLPTNLNDFYNNLLVSNSRKYRIWFTLKNNLEIDTNIDKNYFVVGKEYAGYIYDIVEFGSTDYLIIYIDANSSVLVTQYWNVKLTQKPMDMGEWLDSINFTLKDPTYSSIYAWFNDYFKGQSGKLLNFKIKINYDDQIRFKYIKHSIEDYWYPLSEYKVIDEVEEVEIKDENGNVTKVNKIVHYAIIDIRCNESSFRNWYINRNMFYHVIILEPKELNNKYFGDMICMLKNRVDKYGEKK